MSLVVREGYKLKDSVQLWPFIRWMRKRATVNMKATLRDRLVAEHIDPVVFESALKYASDNPHLQGKLGEHMTAYLRSSVQYQLAGKQLREKFDKASNSPFRDMDDFEASVAFRELDGQVYFIPHIGLGFRDCLAFLQKSSKVKQFWVDTRVDGCPGIPSADWQERIRVWDALNDNGWKDYLVLELHDKKSYLLQEVEAEMRKELYASYAAKALGVPV